MKVDTSDIPAEGLNLKIGEEIEEVKAVAEGMGFSVISPVSADLVLLKSGEEIFVSGDMSILLNLRCSRCLKDFEQSVNTNIDIVYTTAPVHESKEKELTLDEVSTQYLTSDEININAILAEQLALDMPMQPVCNNSCKGLCPKCGADLNQGKCSCPATDHIDPRFKKLKELKLK